LERIKTKSVDEEVDILLDYCLSLVFVIRRASSAVWLKESDVFRALSLGDAISINDIRVTTKVLTRRRLSISMSISMFPYAPKTTTLTTLGIISTSVSFVE
jgi:hypothetical protein